MALSPGSRVGPYEILAPIGAGGMGEVYRARDLKLRREIAIKTLLSDLSHTDEQVSRFRREAEVLAALHHPNVATIYGLEESHGQLFIAMELVEGETLADRINRGPIPVMEALPLFVQLAKGLEAAHEKGIIHRDLKPANIKIAPDGNVRVLDFGLAKVFDETTLQGDLSHSPTVAREGTQVATILGTASYMSPEQTRGKRLDRRSDMWSFGCCLFEALSGSKAFDGETVTDVFAAIVRGEPDWNRLPKDLPASLRVLLERCLTKDVAHRLRDPGDAALELEEALKRPAVEARSDRGPSRRVLAIALAFGVVALAFGTGKWLSEEGDSVQPLKTLEVNLPEGLTLSDLEDPVVVLSPDGTRLVFIAHTATGRDQMYVRTLADGATIAVSGTEGASTPFFSPDGAWIGFAAGNFLKKVSVRGGAPTIICDASVDFGATWGEDDTIVFRENPPGLLRVAASGGEPRRFAAEAFSWPVFLPGGRTVLAEYRGGIFTVSLETGESKKIVEQGGSPQYVASGHLIYEYERSLHAAVFDLDALEVRETAIPLTNFVRRMPVGPAHYDVAADGSLVYLAGIASSTAEKALVWVERDGSFEPVTRTRRAFVNPRLSPDSRRIAVGIAEGRNEADLWVHEVNRDTLRRVTIGASSIIPVWSPDGRQLAYSTRQNDVWCLMRANSDGSGEPLKIIENGDTVLAPDSWSPDGGTLLYSLQTPDRGWDQRLFLVKDGSSRDFVSSPSYDAEGMFSPDGKWVVYASSESGLNELYVQSLTEPGKRWQLSDQYGRDPVWTSHGKEIVFRSGRRILSVSVRMEPDFEASVPQVLFEGPFELETGGWRNYDVTRDGQRFIMVHSNEGPVNRFIYVVNWLEELNRLVAPKN
jgi:serine/threonine-protein kinase